MEEALTAQLIAAGVASGRVYWAERPQGSALPAVVLYKISVTPVDSDDDGDDLVATRVQCDCLGPTALDAITTCRALKAALPKSFERDGVSFQGAYHDGELQDFATSTAGERVHRNSVDFILWHAN